MPVHTCNSRCTRRSVLALVIMSSIEMAIFGDTRALSRRDMLLLLRRASPRGGTNAEAAQRIIELNTKDTMLRFNE